MYRTVAREIFVWGNNRNYNLGIGNDEEKMQPHQMDFFNKLNTSIRKVSLSTYHCMYLDDLGKLYVVGHGLNGQLGKKGNISIVHFCIVFMGFNNAGNGKECTLVEPQLIHFTDDSIRDISAARNHSLLLTNNNSVSIFFFNKFLVFL